MLDLYAKLHTRLAQDDGQTMAEYAVVLAVIAIGIFVALGVLSGAIRGALNSVANQIQYADPVIPSRPAPAGLLAF